MNGRALLLLGAGFTIWAAAFVVLYALLSVGCRFGWDRMEVVSGLTVQRMQLVVLFLLHLAACVALVAALRRHSGLFLQKAAYGAALAAAGSTLFTFLPVLVLSPCH